MFDVLHERSAEIIADLLQLYRPSGAKIIDFTFGTGALWWKIFETPELCKKYRVTACDAVPFDSKEAQAPRGFRVTKRNLLEDDYGDLGKHDVGLVDFPYRIGKPSSTKANEGRPVAIQLMGPRSWAASKGDTSRFMYNESEESFNERVDALNRKAPSCLKPRALLINKIMNVGDGKGRLVPHAYNCWRLFTNFELIEDPIYVRHDTGPYRRRGQLERIHGHFQIFRLKEPPRKPQKQVGFNGKVSLPIYDSTLELLQLVCKAKKLRHPDEAINWLWRAEASRRGQDWTLRAIQKEERESIEDEWCMRHLTHIVSGRYIIKQTLEANKISRQAAVRALDRSLGEYMGLSSPGWPSCEWKNHHLIISSGEDSRRERRTISLNQLLDWILRNYGGGTREEGTTTSPPYDGEDGEKLRLENDEIFSDDFSKEKQK